MATKHHPTTPFDLDGVRDFWRVGDPFHGLYRFYYLETVEDSIVSEGLRRVDDGVQLFDAASGDQVALQAVKRTAQTEELLEGTLVRIGGMTDVWYLKRSDYPAEDIVPLDGLEKTYLDGNGLSWLYGFYMYSNGNIYGKPSDGPSGAFPGWNGTQAQLKGGLYFAEDGTTWAYYLTLPSPPDQIVRFQFERIHYYEFKYPDDDPLPSNPVLHPTWEEDKDLPVGLIDADANLSIIHGPFLMDMKSDTSEAIFMLGRSRLHRPSTNSKFLNGRPALPYAVFRVGFTGTPGDNLEITLTEHRNQQMTQGTFADGTEADIFKDRRRQAIFYNMTYHPGCGLPCFDAGGGVCGHVPGFNTDFGSKVAARSFPTFQEHTAAFLLGQEDPNNQGSSVWALTDVNNGQALIETVPGHLGGWQMTIFDTTGTMTNWNGLASSPTNVFTAWYGWADPTDGTHPLSPAEYAAATGALWGYPYRDSNIPPDPLDPGWMEDQTFHYLGQISGVANPLKHVFWVEYDVDLTLKDILLWSCYDDDDVIHDFTMKVRTRIQRSDDYGGNVVGGVGGCESAPGVVSDCHHLPTPPIGIYHNTTRLTEQNELVEITLYRDAVEMTKLTVQGDSEVDAAQGWQEDACGFTAQAVLNSPYGADGTRSRTATVQKDAEAATVVVDFEETLNEAVVYEQGQGRWMNFRFMNNLGWKDPTTAVAERLQEEDVISYASRFHDWTQSFWLFPVENIVGIFNNINNEDPPRDPFTQGPVFQDVYLNGDNWDEVTVTLGGGANPEPFRGKREQEDIDRSLPVPTISFHQMGNRMVIGSRTGRKGWTGIFEDAFYNLILQPNDQEWQIFGTWGPTWLNDTATVMTTNQTNQLPVTPEETIEDYDYGDDVWSTHDPRTGETVYYQKQRVAFK